MAVAPVAVTDQKEQTPLHIAAQEGNVEVVKLLCKNKARLISRDKDGNTPMDLWANRRREIKENEKKRTNTKDDTEYVDGQDDEIEKKMLKAFEEFCVKQDEDQKLQIDKVMTKPSKNKTDRDKSTKDDIVAEHLRSMTPFGYVSQSIMFRM